MGIADYRRPGMSDAEHDVSAVSARRRAIKPLPPLQKASRFLDIKIKVQETGGYLFKIVKPHQSAVIPVAADINKYTRTPEKNPNSTPDTDRLCGWLLGFPIYLISGKPR